MNADELPVVTGNDLKPYLGGSEAAGLPGMLAAFIRHQCATWDGLREARSALDGVLTRSMLLSDLEITLQHNPRRMKSSAASVDAQSVKDRPCFLCPDRLYPEQKALVYQDAWLILNNPFPIFVDHLVVSHCEHLPQRFAAALPTMISFADDSAGSCSVFYNGPACGASAPDHLHFQACPSGSLPIERQAESLARQISVSTTLVDEGPHGSCRVLAPDGRGLFFCRAARRVYLHDCLLAAFSRLAETCSGSAAEPPVNLIISRDAAGYSGMLFPRSRHRPDCFFRTGAHRLLISPGSVDVGGLLIVPRKEDYDKISREDVLHIFTEVCHDNRIFEGLVL